MIDIESFRRERWKLDQILFRVRLPESRYLDKVFTGRAAEIEECRIAVNDAPSNILVNGVFGVGKTIFIKELLRKLQLCGTDTLTVYETLEKTGTDLLTTILRGIARALRDEDEEARNIDAVLSGLEISSKESHEFGSKVKGGIPGLITVETSPKENDTIIRTAKTIANAAYQHQVSG